MLPTLLYMSPEKALNCGFTHHGTLFGIPVWVRADEEVFWACPKIPLLQGLTLTFDAMLTAASFFAPMSLPSTVGREIQAKVLM